MRSGNSERRFVPAPRGPTDDDFWEHFSVRKSPFEMTLEERKVELTLRLLVEVADQDYITSRWGFQNGAFHTFYWSGAQALEKYLKAVLLLKGESADGYKHNLNSLFARVRKISAVNDLPKKLKLARTTAQGRGAWSGKSLELYIDYMNAFGSPDNRYAFEGLHINGPVLHALDFVCLHLRMIMNKDNTIAENLFAYRNRGRSTIKKGKAAPSWMVDKGLPLERLFLKHYQVGEGAATRKVFRTMNLAFFTDKHRHSSSFGGYVFQGSPLVNHLVRLNNEEFPEQSADNTKIIEQLRVWVGENIQLSDRARKAVGLPERKSIEKTDE